MGYFLDMEHKENFNELMERAKVSKGDTERKALFYIVSGNFDLYNKVNHIYNFEENKINIDCLEGGKVDFSSSSRTLVKLAYNLYNSYPSDSVIDTFYLLDEQNFKLAMNAIRLRFNM